MKVFGRWPGDLPVVGARVVVSGRVKAHEVWEGHRQTRLTHVKPQLAG